MAKSTPTARKDAKGGSARKGAAPKPAKKATTSPPAKSAKAPAKPAPKAPAKSASKPTPKPPVKHNGKAPAKQDAKSAPKPVIKPIVKHEAKHEAQPSKSQTTKAPAKGAKPAALPPKGPAKAAPAPAPAAPAGQGRKGITIVSNKPVKKPAPKPSQIKIPEYGTPLSEAIRKPLITSGPKAPKPRTLAEGGDDKPRKTPFNAKELAYYKQLLLKKRSELIGDVSTMETEALMSQSGSLSNLPQHMAEQGSDAYGQSLSLDLAAADRKLIKEIDDALKRITDGTFGVCELTGKPIRKERLEELPWARHSIEAARELERRTSLT